MKCTAPEVSEIRRVVGAVGWIARQSRPDLLVGVSLLAQNIGDPRVSHVVAANTLIRSALQNADFKLTYRHDRGIDYSCCRLLCSSDASFANATCNGERIKSQCGYVVAVREKTGEGMHCLEFATSLVKRVCRSTLAAEANSLVTAVEAADYIRSVILAMTRPGLPLAELMDRGDVIPCDVYTDARSLYDVVSRDTSRPADQRLRVVIAQLREMFLVEGTTLRWIDNSLMLADCLTKLGSEREYLLQAARENSWSDVVSPEALKVKERIRSARHQRAEAVRAEKKARVSE